MGLCFLASDQPPPEALSESFAIPGNVSPLFAAAGVENISRIDRQRLQSANSLDYAHATIRERFRQPLPRRQPFLVPQRFRSLLTQTISLLAPPEAISVTRDNGIIIILVKYYYHCYYLGF